MARDELTPRGALEGQWVQTELGEVWREPKLSRSRITPHATLKKCARIALTEWRRRKGVAIVLLPSLVGRVQTMNGNPISVGKRGQADDMVLVNGRAVALEYKAGADALRPDQRAFAERWIAAGGIYAVVRTPADAIAAVERAM